MPAFYWRILASTLKLNEKALATVVISQEWLQWVPATISLGRSDITIMRLIFMSSLLRGGGHIDFGVDPVCVSICIIVIISYQHNILWTSGCILTKFSWLYNVDITKNWLVGDLDLIFKVTALEKLKIHCRGHLFSLKTLLLVILFLHENICCGYLLEAPYWGTSIENPQ